MKRELQFSPWGKEELIPFPDKELDKAVKEKYDFETGYMPEGFGEIFLMVKENEITKRTTDDEWISVSVEKTETGFNLTETFRGNFSGIIDHSVNLIKRDYNRLAVERGEEPVEISAEKE